MNLGSTTTQTTLPRSIISQGWIFIDPGLYGAGSFVFFHEAQLPIIYAAMTPPVIV